MAAVEEPQLHRFERSHVVDQLGAYLLPSRSSGDKIVLDRPLLERLVHDRRGIVHAERRIVVGDVGLRRCRHDAIDHGRWKACVPFDPPRERWVARFGERRDQATNHGSVMRQVVAAQNRERAAVRASTGIESRDNQADRAL